jgi:tetratricopeptide (TPR) repeat protein
MARKDRKQQKKRKERQDRLRREKHLRLYGPGVPGSDLVPDTGDDLDEENETDLDLPPETATERMLRGIGGGSSLVGKLRGLLPWGRSRSDACEQAQELAYDAMEEPDPGRAAEFARRALALDPESTDALYVLALNAAGSRQEQIELLEQAVAAAERRLGGPSYFAENRGHFWGVLETRPYMRARAALADILRGEGRVAEAISHYEALLGLNPNDNQGLRDVLLGCYFLADDLKGVRRLLEQYDGDGSAIFQYGRVLERFLSGNRQEAARVREVARQANPHVEVYLIGRKKLPRRLPEYYSPGAENEAVHSAVYLTDAWQRHAEAVAWLKSLRQGAG